MKNVKVIKKAAIFLMVFVLAFSSLSAAAAVTYSRGGKRVILVQVTKCIIIVKEWTVWQDQD